MTKTMRKSTKKTVAKTAETGKTAVVKKTVVKKAAAKKSVAKKAPAKKKVAASKAPAAKKAVAKKAPVSKTAVRKTQVRRITAGDRRQMIAEAAYLRAEAQSFFSDEREDWLLAEAEIDMRLVRAKIDVID